jgi:hypothetical protein
VEIEHWKTKEHGGSWSQLRTDLADSKFYLADDTGKIVIDGNAAELDLPQAGERVVDSSRPSQGSSGPTDAELLQYVSYSGVHKVAGLVEHWLGKAGPFDDPQKEQARHTFSALALALPTAMRGGAIPVDLIEQFMSARGPLANPEMESKRQMVLAQFHEMAQSGRIPAHIMAPATGRYRLKEYLILPGQQYSVTGTCTENSNTLEAHNLICKGKHETTFLISSRSERETRKNLRSRALWMILGGAAISLVCLAIILSQLKLL